MRLRLARIAKIVVLTIVVAAGINFSGPRPQDDHELTRAYTREIEFDHLGWMLEAARFKAQAAAAGLPVYLDRPASRIVVSDYLHVTQSIIRAEEALDRIYSDPEVADKDRASSQIRRLLDSLNAQNRSLAILAESVLQDQIAQVLADEDLVLLGQPMPAVLFRSTSVPDALVISPREVIRQIANVSIEPDLHLNEQVELEQRVESGLDVSALVVPVGGVGIYPTMIMRTTDRHWLVSTIAHEWTHNYLQLRPLGMLYDATPELRTMNETVADIVGTEISQAVIARFYSGFGTTPDMAAQLVDLPRWYPEPPDNDPPPFEFRAEMHKTRIVVDALLASGRIPEAEAYMERRRHEFVQHGYYIRRLNQAYFAFYGAYADTPGGPAGADPVGPAVRELRSRSRSLADFVKRISWMASYDQLQKAVGQ